MTITTNKFNMPRHPIVIIGAGMAGLAAAARLWDLGVPHLVLERFDRPGGRFSSRRGDGWIADTGTQYITREDESLLHLIRWCGMEERRTVVQGGVHQLHSDGTITHGSMGGVDPNRMCIDLGFGELATQLAKLLNVEYRRAVGAIRWDNDEKTFWWQKEGQVFWFEDEDGEPLRDHTTRDVLVASGVILATTPTQATLIARRSRSLSALVPLVESVNYTSCFTGVYRLPRQATPFYAVKGDPDCRIKWLSFEERKAPERISEEYSLMVVQAAPRWSGELVGMSEGDAMYALYQEARSFLPQLPEKPISQTYKRWHVAQLDSEPLGTPAEAGLPGGLWPVSPGHAPFALAGDYLYGPRAEHAVRSGEEAAMHVVKMIPRRKSFLGLEMKS